VAAPRTIAMTSGVSVLLVSTATRAYGTARAPRSLAKAGFDVTLLTPPNSLAETSRFVRRIAYLPPDATTMQWVHALAATVKGASPLLVIPCDDLAFRLLAMLVVAPPAQLQPALQQALAQLITRSLGDPAHYLASVDRTRVSTAAAAAGVPVPAHALVTTRDEAQAFAATHGYPIVVKRPHVTAGNGVRRVRNGDELSQAMAALPAPDAADSEPDAAGRIVVQQHVDGDIRYQNVAAWQGRMLAGYAADRLQGRGGRASSGTVVRHRHDADLRDHSQRLVEAFGISGFFASEYVIERATGRAYLLEIYRRIGPGTHYGSVMNVDLCAALHAALHDAPSPTRAGLEPGEERVCVQFPGEWLRDPASRWLRQSPVDVPWDDPELLEAMLALRNEA
jgi:predicted ATP-grasp superfamily ATP-dependent carboligase